MLKHLYVEINYHIFRQCANKNVLGHIEWPPAQLTSSVKQQEETKTSTAVINIRFPYKFLSWRVEQNFQNFLTCKFLIVFVVCLSIWILITSGNSQTETRHVVISEVNWCSYSCPLVIGSPRWHVKARWAQTHRPHNPPYWKWLYFINANFIYG